MKPTIVLLLIFNVLFADSYILENDVKLLNESREICLEYEIIETTTTEERQCTVNDEYQDYELTVNISETDEYQFQENCVRLNKVEEARPTQEVTFSYVNNGFFRTVVKKTYIDDTEENLYQLGYIDEYVYTYIDLLMDMVSGNAPSYVAYEEGDLPSFSFLTDFNDSGAILQECESTFTANWYQKRYEAEVRLYNGSTIDPDNPVETTESDFSGQVVGILRAN